MYIHILYSREIYDHIYNIQYIVTNMYTLEGYRMVLDLFPQLYGNVFCPIEKRLCTIMKTRKKN